MITVNDPQYEFLKLPHKFRAFVAGFGTGKTVVGCTSQCIHYLEHPRVNQGYFAPTYPQIRDIFYPTIEEVAYQFNIPVTIKSGDKEVQFGKGRFYRGTTLCRSMERPGTIIGFKIGRGFLDEIDTLPMLKATEAWRKIIARLRWENCKNGVDLATTPEGFLFTYKTFVESLIKNPKLTKNYGLIQASTYDNEKNLPDDYISSLFETYPSELIDAYINGRFVNLTSGTVYNSFDRITCNSNEQIKENEPLFIGMDFNVGKMAARVFVARPSGWHCVDEINDVFDTPSIITIIQDRYRDHHVYVYPDSSGKSRKTVDASTSDIELLRYAGFTVRANSVNPRVKDRVMSTNKQFQDKMLYVNVESCPVTAANLEQQAYDTNGEPDKKNGSDHGNDAFGYPIAYEFPIKKRSVYIHKISGV